MKYTKMFLKVEGDKAELLCSDCKGPVYEGGVNVGSLEFDPFIRLQAAWEEMNGDLNDIRCKRCRGGKSVLDGIPVVETPPKLNLKSED